MSQPLQESDLIFSSAASALKTALGDLKKSNLSIKNRLRSIREDAQFVCQVADTYQLPLIANERCGSWYIPPNRKAGSAYFKSTDGHFGEWRLSLRRLNLQVLDVVGEHGGCIVVDSTRRGKSMPDALSKTVPFWVAVLNRLLFPDDEDARELRTPMDVVSESEHAQMEARLITSLEGLRALGLDVDELRMKLKNRPLQVAWQRPGDALPDGGADIASNVIVLCTASNQTSNETSATSDYVQGAADDPESWSCGLDATNFWRHEQELLAADEDELPALIERLMAGSNARGPSMPINLIKPTNNLWIGTNQIASEQHSAFDFILSCTEAPRCDLETSFGDRYITLICKTGKNGSRQLRAELSKLEALRLTLKPDSQILVTCETGKDLSVGVALALLCLYYSEDGKFLSSSASSLNKNVIKQRLSWIVVSRPDANPSRTTLQSVNSFLLG